MKIAKLLPLLCLVVVANTIGADELQGIDETQANNPLANMTAFSIHNYYIGDVTESSKSANQSWVRYAQPFSLGESRWLLRASLPVNTFPTPPNGAYKTGLGDLNLFASWLIDTGHPTMSFGFGPQLTAPTATDNALGTEKWSAGLVNVLYNASSPRFQYGYLISWQHSFAGENHRSDVNLATFQPFLLYQLGGGTYLRASPIWVYNFQNDSYSVPMGLGIGQVIMQGKTVYNFFLEPQASVANHGPGQPRWQIFAGLTLQFLN